MVAGDEISWELLGAVPAISLPWLGGWLAVRAVPAIRAANRYLQISLGFLAGQMLLLAGMALGDALLGHWSVWMTLGVLAAAALLGFGVVARTDTSLKPPHQSSPSQQTGWQRTLSILFLSLCALHLTFTAIEILHRPVYPWDAWLNWMYRAKAWYYADSWLAFDTPGMWLAGVRENAYAVAGRHYPPLVPVTAVWMALWTGGWTETLVNLPTLALGFALAFGVYGLAEEAGLPPWPRALATYLLSSLPLLGAHLSLAGMADSWMAAYAGLGFACLFLGLYQKQAVWIVLGLMLVALSRLVKLEGGVWFLVALPVVAVALRPRLSLAAVALGVLVVFIGLSAGYRAVNLPFLGVLGVADDRLYVPLIGSFALADWQLLDDYRDNFLRGGSWHLAWVGLIAAIALLLRFRYWRAALLGFLMLCALALAFIGIFQFTEQGAWAEDWSAINRLPLHMAPLLASLLTVGVQLLATVPQRASKTAAIVMLVLTCGTFSALLLWAANDQARGESGDTLTFDSQSLTAVVGTVTVAGDGSLSYDGYEGGITVLTSGPMELPSSASSLVTVVSRGANREAMTLFWRTSDAPDELQTMFIDQRGKVAVDLGAEPAWSGTILEIGITAFDDGGTLMLEEVRLEPNNATSQLRKALGDWLTPNNWSQRSVNWIDAGGVETRISLPLLLGLTLAVMAGFALLPGITALGGARATAVTLMIFWCVLDSRWLYSRLQMASQTISEYPLLLARALSLGGDTSVWETAQFVDEALDIDHSLAPPGNPPIVALASEVDAEKFQRLRARYHLLPAAAIDLTQREALSGSPADHLLVLKRSYREPGQVDQVAADWRSTLPDWTPAADTKEFLLLARPAPR